MPTIGTLEGWLCFAHFIPEEITNLTPYNICNGSKCLNCRTTIDNLTDAPL